jgi:1,4-dihydroxy-2-naphthoate octaprenyltransferase
MASSIFYTTPPIRFGYRGFGELGLLINFGPVIVMGSYYVQAQTFAFEPLLASLVPGFMMWSMIIINEIPDYETDRRGGKWNLVARFGRKTGVVLYGIGLMIAYGILITAALANALPPFILLGLISLPFAIKSFAVMGRHLNDPLKMAPANLAMIKVHSITAVAMIIAYLIEVFRLAA